MLATHATALIGLLAVLVAWVAVQCAWRRVFPGAFADPDVLAERMGCHACGCTEICERGRPRRSVHSASTRSR